MNKNNHRWVRRSTPDSEVIYDRDSRVVYRNRLPTMIDESQDLWSLPPCLLRTGTIATV